MTAIELRTDSLQREMTKRGIATQDELARRMGVNSGGVSIVLRGKRKPGNLFMARLLNALPGTTFDDLFQVTSAHAA